MGPIGKLTLVWIVFYALVAPGARAAQLDLSLSTAAIEVGQRFDVLIRGADFPNGTDGGDFSLDWTGNLAFVGIAVEDPPWDVSAVDQTGVQNGVIVSVDVFSADDTPGDGGTPFPIARLTLEATAEGAATVTIGFDRVGWSLQGDWLDYQLPPQLEIEVAPLPEPGGPMAMALASLAVSALARQRRRKGARRKRGQHERFASHPLPPVERSDRVPRRDRHAEPG